MTTTDILKTEECCNQTLQINGQEVNRNLIGFKVIVDLRGFI